MNILLISQCRKNAREQSCQILDQFAERKGDATWQTAITLEGVDTLRRLLRKTARRNTAIACHWIKKSGQTELLWIVGNRQRFSATGVVPTNQTSRNILRQQHESTWRTTETIALLAGIAGLFHDVGKAGALFQAGLRPGAKKSYQPFRHEWLSLRFFQAFVGEMTDQQWLQKLGTITAADENDILQRLRKDTAVWSDSPFTELPPVARIVGWLIVAHHRLPQYHGSNAPFLSSHSDWLSHQLNVNWNALNHKDGWSARDFQRVWQFPSATPLQSHHWQSKAAQLAKRAVQAGYLQEHAALERPFTAHLARLALMLADHYYSSLPPEPRWQDEACRTWANTDRQTKQLKQKLDEHNIGVGHYALLTGRALPLLRRTLPAITRHKGFRERVKKSAFHWQDLAFEKALSLREASFKHGFFGINMASTGCGKTFANARIMYALANEEEGCRFTIALGLRTLTLQTGDALRHRLHLSEDDLAVLVGSAAVRELHGLREMDTGSQSADALFDSHDYVHYDGVINSGPLRHLLDSDPKLSKLLNAPVLVATIDHLMPATEGVRGGKQIAPMLRLLTSDLVLDEPDDFDIADQHALCRLVNWSGMLGGRVLLSSATLPPALVQALFAAYCKGREAFQQACGETTEPINVCCAWFDEYKSSSEQCSAPGEFYQAHARFTELRAKKLAEKKALRQAKMVIVEPPSLTIDAIVSSLAGTVHQAMLDLHSLHHETHENGKTLSLGLVRIANIDPLVALAKALMNIPSPEDYCIHYCVYHSQHPLAVRAHMEKHLDTAFTRHDKNLVWQQPTIKQALEQSDRQHHLFVVLGTSVVEVGRDWDADWGIIEPSSMRSLIQFAGRIQRHRQDPHTGENLLILNKNIRGLRSNDNQRPAFCKPGFESSRFLLNSHDLTTLLTPEHYQRINANPRILDQREPYRAGKPFTSLITLEHMRSWEELLGKGEDYPVAAHWWRLPLHWCGELQRRTPFRRTQPEMQFFMRMEDELAEPVFMQPDDGPAGWKDPGLFTPVVLEMDRGVGTWIDNDYADVMLALAESMDREVCAISDIFGAISLRMRNDAGMWMWHPQLGVFSALI